MSAFSLKDHDLHVEEVYRNPAPALLYEHAIRFETEEKIADRGALVAYSGAKTGRSPRDKRWPRASLPTAASTATAMNTGSIVAVSANV